MSKFLEYDFWLRVSAGRHRTENTPKKALGLPYFLASAGRHSTGNTPGKRLVYHTFRPLRGDIARKTPLKALSLPYLLASAARNIPCTPLQISKSYSYRPLHCFAFPSGNPSYFFAQIRRQPFCEYQTSINQGGGLEGGE